MTDNIEWEPSEHSKQVKCLYCRSPIEEGAQYCKACQKYQKDWRNWLPYLGALLTAVSLSGSAISFAISYSKGTETEAKVIEAERVARESQAKQEREMRDLQTAEAIGEAVVNVMVSIARSIEDVLMKYDAINSELSANVLRNAVVNGKGHLEVDSSDCGMFNPMGDTRCRVSVVMKNADGAEVNIRLWRGSQITELAKKIRLYVEKLDAIDGAENKAQLVIALDATLGMPSELAQFLNPAEVPSNLPDSSALTDGSIGSMKLQALQIAMANVDSVLRNEVSATALKHISVSVKLVGSYPYSELVHTTLINSDLSTAKNYDRLVASVRAYDAFLTLNTLELLTEFIAVHSTVAARLKDNAPLSDVYWNLERLEGQINSTNAQLEDMRLVGFDFLGGTEQEGMTTSTPAK